MASEKHILDVARTSTDDFYALLNLDTSADESAIKSAYRKTALRYHPDKHSDDPDIAVILEKWHKLSTAYAVLLDPAAREAYDKARVLRKEREDKERAFFGKRKALKDALEQAETGTKRKAQDVLDQDRKVRRIMEENRRKREEQDWRRQQEADQADQADRKQDEDTAKVDSEVPEIERTIKVRWLRKDQGEQVDRERLGKFFSKFGRIESVAMLKDRKIKLGGEKHRRPVAAGLIIYASIISAHNAVSEALASYPFLDAVSWASQESDPKSPIFDDASASTPSTPSRPPKSFSTPLKDVLGKGFGAAAGDNDKPSFSFSPAPKINNSEEATLMRLKQRQAEKRKLEEQIRQEEATAAEG